MTPSVSARLRALEEDVRQDGYHVDFDTCCREGCNYRADCSAARERVVLLAAIREEIEAVAKEIREKALRSKAKQRVMNPISAAEAWEWADRLARGD